MRASLFYQIYLFLQSTFIKANECYVCSLRNNGRDCEVVFYFV